MKVFLPSIAPSKRRLTARSAALVTAAGLTAVLAVVASAALMSAVCRKTDCLEGCPLQFKIYSPAGDFQCDFGLRPGPFVLSADFRFKRIVVTGRGIYGLLERADDPDGYLHLVRKRFAPA